MERPVYIHQALLILIILLIEVSIREKNWSMYLKDTRMNASIPFFPKKLLSTLTYWCHFLLLSYWCHFLNRNWDYPWIWVIHGRPYLSMDNFCPWITQFVDKWVLCKPQNRGQKLSMDRTCPWTTHLSMDKCILWTKLYFGYLVSLFMFWITEGMYG